MADVTIYKPSDLTVEVLDGPAPADQSAQVAQLTADLATRTSERDDALAQVAALNAKIDAAKAAAQAAKDADAATIDGQAVLDALA